MSYSHNNTSKMNGFHTSKAQNGLHASNAQNGYPAMSLYGKLTAKETLPNHIGNGHAVREKITLERQGNFKKSIILLLCLLCFEIAKQLCNFSLSNQNSGKFPIPMAMLLTMIECMKIWLIIIAAVIQGKPLYNHGFTWKFGLPALCYFCTGFLYLKALTITSPPIWMIFIQTRTLYTALIYKLKFDVPVTKTQIAGCLLIVASILLTRLSELSSGHATISLELVLMSQAAAILATTACLSVEIFLKNDVRNFFEQQFNLYMWGILSATTALVCFQSPQASLEAFMQVTKDINATTLLVATVVSSALAGLCVPLIVKNLDSIVKDYSAAMNNIVLAGFTALLFPKAFSLNSTYLLSLCVLISGITLYEKKSLAFLRPLWAGSRVKHSLTIEDNCL